MVADFPTLSCLVLNEADWMTLTGDPFSPENFGILFPEDSLAIEAVSTSLLKLRESGRYGKLFEKYFGKISSDN